MTFNAAELAALTDSIRQELDAKHAARELALTASREITRLSANAIRAIHRDDFPAAEKLLADAKDKASATIAALRDTPDIYFAGYTQDGLKEYAEAELTYAFVMANPVPGPEELGLEAPAYLNGYGEAIQELRRRILDIIRRGETEQAERLLQIMDEGYYMLVAFLQYPDAINANLRRTTDQIRSVLERTRGDLTMTIRSQALHDALDRVATDMEQS